MFDPYYTWLGIPPKDQPPNYYRLLGIELFETNADVISNAADRQMLHTRTVGQQSQQSQQAEQLLNELSSARVCLLDPKARERYDDSLRTERIRRLASVDSRPPMPGPTRLDPGAVTNDPSTKRDSAIALPLPSRQANITPTIVPRDFRDELQELSGPVNRSLRVIAGDGNDILYRFFQILTVMVVVPILAVFLGIAVLAAVLGMILGLLRRLTS